MVVIVLIHCIDVGPGGPYDKGSVWCSSAQRCFAKKLAFFPFLAQCRVSDHCLTFCLSLRRRLNFVFKKKIASATTDHGVVLLYSSLAAVSALLIYIYIYNFFFCFFLLFLLLLFRVGWSEAPIVSAECQPLSVPQADSLAHFALSVQDVVSITPLPFCSKEDRSMLRNRRIDYAGTVSSRRDIIAHKVIEAGPQSRLCSIL